jgi:glyoxylase-like metal-dependent hydrolase (beta-lactamase superfamily II)
VATSEGLAGVVVGGDHVGALRALAAHLAAHIEVAEARDVASLSRVFAATLDRLAELAPPVVAATPLDEMRARREAKRAS